MIIGEATAGVLQRSDSRIRPGFDVTRQRQSSELTFTHHKPKEVM